MLYTLMGLIMLLNGVVWLAISLLVLYNVYEYTVDKYNLRKEIHPFFRKYFKLI